MQSNTSLRKWSDLQGLAAVTMDTGQKAGTLDDFYFDPHTATILAFAVKTGVFGHRVLPVSSINAVGQDAITFPGESSLVKENSSAELQAAPTGRGLLSYKVLSEGGNVVGTLGNVTLDTSVPTAIRIASLELAGGLRERISGRYPSFTPEQIVRYGQDVLVILDSVAQSLH